MAIFWVIWNSRWSLPLIEWDIYSASRISSHVLIVCLLYRFCLYFYDFLAGVLFWHCGIFFSFFYFPKYVACQSTQYQICSCRDSFTKWCTYPYNSKSKMAVLVSVYRLTLSTIYPEQLYYTPSHKICQNKFSRGFIQKCYYFS